MVAQAPWIERNIDLTFRVPDWFNEELFNTVLQRVGEGDTFRTVSKELGFNKGTFWRICEENPELARRYARARDVQAHDHFERIIDLAKQVEKGEIDPQAAKVAIDARKWAACKLMPRSYGDRVEIDQKVTHEVGDSVVGLLNGLRVEQERAVIEESAPIIQLQDTPSNVSTDTQNSAPEVGEEMA